MAASGKPAFVHDRPVPIAQLQVKTGRGAFSGDKIRFDAVGIMRIAGLVIELKITS